MTTRQEMTEVQEALSWLNTDYLMLEERSWTPDADTIQAGLDNIERIAKALNLKLDDYRQAPEAHE